MFVPSATGKIYVLLLFRAKHLQQKPAVEVVPVLIPDEKTQLYKNCVVSPIGEAFQNKTHRHK